MVSLLEQDWSHMMVGRATKRGGLVDIQLNIEWFWSTTFFAIAHVIHDGNNQARRYVTGEIETRDGRGYAKRPLR